MSVKKEKYTRKVLFKSKDVEIVLITWPPKSKTPFHDHGKSWGLVQILEGEIEEKAFYKTTKSLLRRALYKKDSIAVESPHIIHQMRNASETKIAKSIHIYTPKLKMKNYSSKSFE